MNATITSLLNASPIDWQAVLDAAIAGFNGSTGTLHRLDPADNLLKIVAQTGIPDQLKPVIATISIGKGIAGAAAERREPVELCNLQADLGGVAKPGARSTNVQGSLAVPILEGDTLRGTIGVGLMVPHDFTDDEKARLGAVASLIAPKLA